jgi:hypothetical protein
LYSSWQYAPWFFQCIRQHDDGVKPGTTNRANASLRVFFAWA